MGTIREILERAYLPEHDLASITARTQRTQLKVWERLTGDPAADKITPKMIRRFRQAMQAAGYSPDYVEDIIRTVSQVLRFAWSDGLIPSVPHSGRKLKRRQTPKYVPPVADLGKLYAAADCAKWPTFCSPGVFWRCLLCVAYWTALRRSDLFFRLGWESIRDDRLTVTANKTGKSHSFPLHPVVRRHLDSWRALCAEIATSATGATGVRSIATAQRIATGRIFPVGNCHQQIRREFHRLSKAAGIQSITSQTIRRLSCTEWQAAKWGAGEVVQGAALSGSSRLYIVPRILVEAAPLMRWPDEMLTAEEKDRRRNEEAALLASFRRLEGRDRIAVASLAERLAG